MSERTPAWLTPAPLPEWLSGAPVELPPAPTPEGKALLFAQYEMVMPRILEMISSGWTLKKAFRDLPEPIDHGGFIRWLKKNPTYYSLYKEAKELRTEAWSDEIIRHAEGKDEYGNDTLADVSRSRLIVDTYWKLMGAHNKKEYGDTKTIELNQTISITDALAQAQNRVMAQVIDDDVIDAVDYKQLSSGEDEEDND